MVNISENSTWTSVTRIEPTDIALGGNETNAPNKQLKQLVNRTKWLKDALTPIFSVDKYLLVSSVVGTFVTSNVMSNSVGQGLQVVKFFYNGVEKSLGVAHEIVYGNLVFNANGIFSYTIINNQATTDFNLLPANSFDDVKIQYLLEDDYGKQTLGNLILRVNQTTNQNPTVLNPLSDQFGTEAGANIVISLIGVFSDPENGELTYSINNTNPSKIVATLNNTTLTLSFPIWQSDYGNNTGTITVIATDEQGGQANTSFDVTITGLESLFTANYYEFDYQLETSVKGSIYVSASERDSILANDGFDGLFILSNGGNPVFQAIPNNATTIPPIALSTGKIVAVYRFQYNNIDGSYLYATEPEASIVRANSNFTEEGLAFYAFAKDLERQSNFNRFQYTFRPNSGEYIYTLGSQLPGVSLYTFEGVVCEVKQL